MNKSYLLARLVVGLPSAVSKDIEFASHQIFLFQKKEWLNFI